MTHPIIIFSIAISLCGCSKDSSPSTQPSTDLGADALLDSSRDLGSTDTNQTDTDEINRDVRDIDTGDSRLISTQFIGSFGRQEIVDAVPNTVTVENGYSVYWITFNTDGRQANATVTIPFETEPPPDGWSIVVNNPGTVGIADRCAVAFSLVGSGLSGYFGARRFVGVTLDYPGLASAGPHYYLDAESEARSSLDAVRATQELLENEIIPQSRRVAITGLSQGGHATLSAAAIQSTYAPELDVRAYLAVAPASVFVEHWQPGITFDGNHLAYHALLSHSFRQRFGEDQTSPFVDESIHNIIEAACLFDAPGSSLEQRLGTDRSLIFTPEFIDAFSTGSFESFPFMEEGFNANRVRPFQTEAAVRIFQGTSDVVVLESSTSELVDALRRGGTEVEYTVVPDGTHDDVGCSFLAEPQRETETIVSWLREHLQD